MRTATVILLCVLFAAPRAEARYSDINYALGISGGSYVSVPNHSSLNNDLVLGLKFTLDAWVRPAALGSEMAVIGNGFGYRFGLNPSGKLLLRLNGTQEFTGTSTIATGAWTHVAVSVDLIAQSIRFYVNGALDRSITHSGSLSGNMGVFCIGADIGGSVAPAVVTPWNGHLDEVRVWKSAIDFSTALGLLTKTAHAVRWGLYGQYLVSAWQLNGGYLDNHGGNHGSIVGSGTFITSPLPPIYDRIGLAFQNQTATGGGGFAVATVPHSTTLNLTTSYAVEFWMKPSATSGHPSYQTLVCKGDGSKGVMAFWIGLNKANGKIRFAPYGSFTTTMESNVSVPVDQWSHVGVSFGPSPQGGYLAVIAINGNLAGFTTYAQPTSSTTEGILIGAGATVGGANNVYGYGGVIDELRIWNIARSYDEIADNHRIELDGTQAGLAALYHFDGQIRDFSGNNNGSNYLVPTSTAYFVNTTDLPGPPSLTLLEPTAGTEWSVGGTGRIRYQAVGLPWLRIELSRDGGATWPDTLFRGANGTLTQEMWPVEGPPSTQCRIRIVTVTPTPGPIGDTSGVFTIKEEIPVMSVLPASISFLAMKDSALPDAVDLRITNSGGGMLDWNITTTPPSWLSISAMSGSGNDQTISFSVTTTALFQGDYTENLIFSSNASNSPIIVPVTYRVRTPGIWSVQGTTKVTDTVWLRRVPVYAEGPVSQVVRSGDEGRYALLDLPGGSYRIFPRSRYFHFSPVERVFNPLNNNEQGVDFRGSQFDTSVTFRYHEGWNLVSLPVAVGTQEVTALLPDAVSPAFSFDLDSGYVRQTHIRCQVAYWIWFTKADSIVLTGVVFRATGAFGSPKVAGWSMVPMPTGDVRVDLRYEDPAGSLLHIYEYDAAQGYVEPVSGILRSGKAYFVKVRDPGNVIFYAIEDMDESTAPPGLPPELLRSDDGPPPPPPPRD